MTDIFHVHSLSEKAASLITPGITCLKQIKKDHQNMFKLKSKVLFKRQDSVELLKVTYNKHS